MEERSKNCDYRNGCLPRCAPLSVPYVPFQEDNKPQYTVGEGLTKGTLFPGLDLPWKNVANKTHPYNDTPLGELMALGFAINELGLYLDTHRNDEDAFKLFKSYADLYDSAKEKYQKMYGPLTLMAATGGRFDWPDDPWPWEYMERVERSDK